MIQIEQIRNYFPAQIRGNSGFDKHILKEYLQLLILDYLSSTPSIQQVAIIGGTNFRMSHKEQTGFPKIWILTAKTCRKKSLLQMTNGVIQFLDRTGLRVEIKDKDNAILTAFRRNIHFPELLFDLGLSGHKEERFSIKVESQDQEIVNITVITNIKGCGFFFPLMPFRLMEYSVV